MTDLTATTGSNSSSKMRADFAQKAVLPEKQLKDAETFVHTLSQFVAKGTRPDAAVIDSGRKMLETLEQQTEVFMFHAAVLAGQEADSDRELDAKIDAVARNVAKAEQTTTKLRSALKSFS